MDDREQAIASAKQRMAAFRLRQSPSATNSATIAPPAKLHARSHSRNNSMTNFPLSTSVTNNVIPAEEPQETPVPSSPSPRSRPNSHHRRRSSVSTRRESAEMMGVAPPESASDAAGDQSELRRLALWTLEGKGHSDNAFIGGFTKVEIPELNAPEADANFEAGQASKPKALTSFGTSNSLALAGKRDSFGKLLMSASNSLKDQLHTLMEEEEEEEEEKEPADSPSEIVESFRTESPFRDEASFTRTPAPQPNRHRPTGLTLRPLSLTPESLPLSRPEAALPTPSPTPSPRIGGLKSLTLAPSPSVSPAPSNTSVSPVSAPSRRQSLSVSPSPQSATSAQRRMSLGAVSSPTPDAPKRKSSISYKRAHSGEHPSGYLPTPGPTPTSPMPPLHSALPQVHEPFAHRPTHELERPLSPTEQAFLFRSHSSLLCRISDLEKAIAGGRGRLPPGAGVGLDTGPGFGLEELRDRSRSNERPTSIMSMSVESESDSVVSQSSQPSDEMLQLVSDLKAERDELMRDADGWRTRVGDLEKQVGTLTRRVEAERREGWVIRERLGLVEVEKKRVSEGARLEARKLEKAVRAEEDAKAKVEEERDVLGKMLKEERAQREIAEREVETLRREMEQLRTRADQADADLQVLLATPKVEVKMQMPLPRRFNSVSSGASSSSSTDVEEYVPVGLRTLKLNVVEEEDEDRDLPRDVTSESESESDNDELAHYEDDEDLDEEMIFSGDDQTSSSFGSIARTNSHLLRLDLAAVAPDPAPEPVVSPSHAKTGSMEKGWSFPHSVAQPSLMKKDVPKVDHFFECLDALEESEADDEGGLSTYDSATAKQFWRGAIQENEDEDDEMPPFVLPAQPSPPRKGKEWKEIEAAKLDVVAEEEEEEVIPFKFPTFSPFPREESGFDGADLSNTDPATPRPVPSDRLLVPAGTPTKHPKVRKTSVDLSIPGFKPYSGSVPILKAPPPPRGINSPSKAQPTTPATQTPTEPAPKQASPTLIPQPSSSSRSSSPFTTPPKPRADIAGPTFIPRPSTSPQSPPATTMPTMRTPTKPTTIPFPTKLTPLSKTPTTSMPMFIPQPKMTSKPVTRSSLLPHPPPVLTRPPIPQQTAAPASPSASSLSQGLTAKLSQQMQSLTSFWSPWSPSPSMAAPSRNDTEPKQRRARGYVSKERQLERLQLRLQREGVLVEGCEQCTSCRDGVIMV